MERGGGGLHLRAVGLRPATLCLEAVGRPCGRWDAQSWPLSPQLLVTAIPPPPPSLPFPAFPLQPTPPTSPLLSASPESSPARTTAASRSAGNATGTTTAWITATRRPSCAVRNASAGGSGGWGGQWAGPERVPPPTDQHTCPSDRFKCKNNRCIPNRWLCDGDNDCGNNEDESNSTCSGEELCGGQLWGGWGGLFLTSPWVLTVLCLSVCPAQPGPAPPTSSPAPAGAASPSPGRATWMTTAGTARMNPHRVVSGGPSGVGSWGLWGGGGGSWLC